MITETKTIVSICEVLQGILHYRSPASTRRFEIAVDCNEIIRPPTLAIARVKLLSVLYGYAANKPLPKRLQISFRPHKTPVTVFEGVELCPAVKHAKFWEYT